MLIRFVVSNFMSFKDETEFNMLPAKGNGSRQLTNHIKKTKSGIEVLKTAAIYGANASGKSNLIKAIEFLKELVVFKPDEHLIPQSKRFRLDNAYKLKPSTFRIECYYNKLHFDYGVEIKKGKISQEWLYIIDSVKTGKDHLLYERKENKIKFGDYFKTKKVNLDYIETFLKKELKEDYSVLHLLYSRVDGTNIFDEIYDSFLWMKIVTPTSRSSHYMESLTDDLESKKFAEEILSKTNTGIENIVIKEIDADSFFSYENRDEKNELIDDLESALEKDPKSKISFYNGKNFHTIRKDKKKYLVTILKTKHFFSDNLFDFNEESDGTNRLFELIPAFEEMNACDNSVYLIDELERSMHPILAKEILRFFTKKSKSNSQLIFTTHESHLLDDEILRRDEIWFTEKKSDGSTEFYPLSNFNPRGDKVLERGYLEGRYGGIPFLGDFSKLIIEENPL
ncbi:ATP/GTP-binding protein [Flavobacterium procerum]|uniref:ATP/GTP-binding protein n=1 Tax=Flavobacterium procerum TaxID=1455569 RepID=A0ABV6BNU3_9FLAO